MASPVVGGLENVWGATLGAAAAQPLGWICCARTSQLSADARGKRSDTLRLQPLNSLEAAASTSYHEEDREPQRQ
jgi:hypothetical protein